MTIEQLQAENAELKKDLKKVKEVAFKAMHVFGMVNPNGTINEKINLKNIMAQVSGLMQNALMPWGNKDEIKEKFSFLNEIIPIYEKHKEL
jgi:hypothetical protein